jgi:FKBP-type peptidyl-prolyl cis-trans isomerase FkpA
VLTAAATSLAQYADAPTRAPGLSKDDVAKTLYALGVSVGRTLDSFALSPEELESVIQGLRDAQTAKVKTDVLELYQGRIRELEYQRREKRLAAEKARGRAFADEAAKEKGAEVSPTGLVFFTVSEGIGPSPTSVDTVKVHYRGRLVDGREFDSSYKRGEPAQFSLNQVVACWSEGLQKVKAGGRAKLICPASIAYGDKGSGTTIPPGATLVFEVELLDVVRRGSTTVK